MLTSCMCIFAWQAAPMVRQIASALVHLHGLGIAHRDLKPSNILFHSEASLHIKLCDFGFAVHCGERPLKERVGTLLYKAPELCGSSLHEQVQSSRHSCLT